MTATPPPPGWNAGPTAPVTSGPGYPPPPIGVVAQPARSVPVVAWLVPLAAVLAIVGACTPWFHSSLVLDGNSHQLTHALYSWRDGKIGLVAPIGLVAASIGVISLLLGRSSRFGRFGSDPVVAAARAAMIIGGISLVCAIIAWFLVPSNYYFDTEQGRLTTSKLLSEAHANGHSASLTHGPQVGWFLTIAAGVIAVLAGLLMLILRDRGAASLPTASGWPGAPSYGAAPSYGGPSYGAAPMPSYGASPYGAAPSAASNAGYPPPAAPQPGGGGWSTPTSHPGTAPGDPQSSGGSGGEVDLSK